MLLEKHQVTFLWVKGHADNPGNERCDELARMAIQNGALQEDENYGKMKCFVERIPSDSLEIGLTLTEIYANIKL